MALLPIPDPQATEDGACPPEPKEMEEGPCAESERGRRQSCPPETTLAEEVGGRRVLPRHTPGHVEAGQGGRPTRRRPYGAFPWRPHSAGPGPAGLVDSESTQRAPIPPVAERATALLETGTVLIRTHVDVDPDNGLTAVEEVLESAAGFTGRIEVEVVALPSRACWCPRNRGSDRCNSQERPVWSAVSPLPVSTATP